MVCIPIRAGAKMVHENHVEISAMPDSEIGPMTIPLVIVLIIIGMIVITITFVGALVQSAICVYLFSNRRLWILLPFLWGANLFIVIVVGIVYIW